MKLVTTLIANTKGEGKAGDDFWVKAETLLYTALIGYIHYEAPVEEQNFSTLIEFINAMEVREDDEDFKNPVDLMFEELKKRKPDHFAIRQYAKFKLSAGKTAKSILISCGARLAPFDIQELRELTAYDELQLDTLGDRKTALFIIMSDTDDTFNFLISMCYTQLFNLLCEKADDVYGGRLPVHVRCLIDEAANIGQIPRLEKLVATIRSREISCCLVLQAQSQLKALYKDSADTIVGNMDCSIFLGGKEPGTLKELAAALGKETIDSYNTGESRGREVSHLLQVWAEAMSIYHSGKYSMKFSKSIQRQLVEVQKDFMPEDTEAGQIQGFLEHYTGNIYRVCFQRPKQRPYKTNNFYAVLERQNQLDREVYQIVRKEKTDPRRTKTDRSRHRKSEPNG